MIKSNVLISLIAALFVSHAVAADLTISSGMRSTVLIELYTSEGCSSCPPADRWLGRLRDDPRLWKDIVPVAFHVDYWDYLGWRDRFAQSRFSQRQSDYLHHDYLRAVYTPGVMRNGREWRGWAYGQSPLTTDRRNAGLLKANFNGDDAVVEFTPPRRHMGALILNIARLGFDLSSRVGAGENADKVLHHDFVVLDFKQREQLPHDDGYHWNFPGLLHDVKRKAAGIALWITTAGDPTPLQAAGGWLN